MIAPTKKRSNGAQKNALLKVYERMLSIRVAQEELVKMYMEKKIFSMVHFYIGQEAVAVGVCEALKKGDKVMGNHRSHGHYLARGGSFRKMVCELLGRANGSARGKGGSMHMIAKEVNFVGSTPLLGSVVPLSAGVAFEQKYNNRGAVTVAFYGDGASEEGVVYETYNLAALYKLPLLLVIENNLFSINSYIKNRRSPRYDVQKVAEGLGIRFERADGNDYHDVHEKAKVLVDSIRETNEPAVLECMTYRHMAHSTPLMEEGYRNEDTIEKRQEVDSLKKLRNELIGNGIPEKKLSDMEENIRKSIRKDIAFAERSPYPKKNELYSDMYARK